MEGASALQGTCTFYGVVSARGVNYESISIHVLSRSRGYVRRSRQ